MRDWRRTDVSIAHRSTLTARDLTARAFRRIKRLLLRGGRQMSGVYRPRSTNRGSSRIAPAVTDDLAEWARLHGLDCVLVTPAHARERQAPTALGTAPHPNFARHAVARTPERFLVCLPHGRVWGRNGLVVLPDGSFASQAIYDRRHLESDPAYSTPAPPGVVQRRGDSFTLLGEFSNSGNYYHWVHDGILRLHGVQAHLPSDVDYLVPSPLQKHQREMLHLLGLDDEHLVPFSGESAWECERLWFASLPPSGAEIPEAVAWLREQFWAATGVGSAEPRRRFYLSREGGHHARVVNESELVPVLEKHGFEVIRPQQMSVAEQVRLFAQAEVIASATGSGQTNMLFASRETKILEFLEPRWATEKAYVVWSLAEAIGQPFSYLMAESVRNPKLPERADLYVPPLTLERALRQL